MLDVLLATYRPDATMLKEQLDSILAQNGVEINLIRREDTKGLGASGNFSAMLMQSRSEYIAFSDQDDVWLPGKLEKSLARMRELEAVYGAETPLLVFCDGYVTDSTLNRKPGTIFSRQHVDIEKGLRFERLLMQNFVPGNAMLFNAALRRKAGEVPPRALMHDAWVILVAAAFGHIGVVKEPLYSYRQHGGNAIGATTSGARHYLRRTSEGIRAFRARLAGNVAQAYAFAERFGEETPPAAKALSKLHTASWLERRFVIVRHGLFKQGCIRNLALLALA